MPPNEMLSFALGMIFGRLVVDLVKFAWRERHANRVTPLEKAKVKPYRHDDM